MDGGNRADRRKAAKANGVRGQLFSQLVVLKRDALVEVEDMAYGQIAGAIVAGLKGIVGQGAAPFERCAITMGTDHPEHPGALVIELKTDRKASVASDARAL